MVSKIKLLTDIIPSNIEPWIKKDCTDERVRACVVEVFENLIELSEYRKNMISSDISLLNRGFWYALNYRELLSNHNQVRRINYLRSKNQFLKGHPPRSFKLDELRGSVTYTLKNGIKASDGVKNLWGYPIKGRSTSFYFIDCQMAIQIACYTSLLLILGEKKFNTAFDPINGRGIQLSYEMSYSSLSEFLKIKKVSPLPDAGDLCYFANTPEYINKHPYEEQGFNLVCKETSEEPSEVQYLGFGLPSQVNAKAILTIFSDRMELNPIEPRDIIPEDNFEEEEQRLANINNRNIPGLDEVGLTSYGFCLHAERIKRHI